MVIDGIVIPNAYVPLPLDVRWDSEEMKRLHEEIRWFHHDYAFLFDDSNAEYPAFLDQCRKQTDELRSALQQEFENRGLDLWALKKKPPARSAVERKITCLIRPPYFYTNANKANGLRMKQREGESAFVFHFDECHKIDRIRFWECGTYGEMIFSHSVVALLEEKTDMLSESFGDWGKFSSIIADAVGESVDFLKIGGRG